MLTLSPGWAFNSFAAAGYHYIVLNAMLGLDANESWSPHMSDLEELEALFTGGQWEESLLQTLVNANTLSFDHGFAVELADAPTNPDQDAGAGSEAGGSFDIDSHGSYISRSRPKEEFVRFSLPARYAFRIAAPPSTTIHCGATRPNFGELHEIVDK